MSVYFVNTGETETEVRDETQAAELSPTQTEAQTALASFWPKVMEDIKKITQMDLKQQTLPLARIKKIMKLDEEVKMISAEAPMLFAKAAEIFIHELTLRAWVHTEDNKRRTLQRNDIAMAITKYDQFDFLIDIVPRDELKASKPREDGQVRSVNADQIHYYFQLAQQHQQALQQTTPIAQATTQQAIQIVQPQQIQTLTVNPLDQANNQQTSTNATTQQVALLQQAASTATVGQTNVTNTQQQTTPNIQIVQQIVTPNGDVQQIPVQLTPQQLQMIRMQVQSGGNAQPIIIQAAPQMQATTANQPQLIQVSQQANTAQPVYITQATNNQGDEQE
ncbi:nuclear transcription factor Y subunit gamma isoform X2 [Chrysoperla carnea]|uniref:nuclear transcription factor Y subunit gamma isoform X2 n=1 Tax=Chrysoperla carnea TaxID=189513 RepID=UPI001D083A68|nr:nuclear transcription factor Y subunit gamma isoform X2 [Chrysoperla carnea]